MNIKTNSKHVKKNDIFVCIHDENEDRHKYIKDIKNASCIIVDKNINKSTKIPLIKVNDTNNTLFDIYNNYYDKPLKDLNLIGVTGTDGKTTTAFVIREILNKFSKTAYLGTIGFWHSDINEKTRNTTVGIDSFFKYITVLKKENTNNLVMEVSSEGLLHKRCDNLKFKRAIITNVTGDHLNIHKTFKNYLSSKLKLFKLLDKDSIAICNTDDISFDYINKMNINMLTYGFSDNADYKISGFSLSENGTTFDLVFNNRNYIVDSPLLGKFNIYNLTAVIACINSLGIDMETIIESIKNISAIPGRLNVFTTRKKATLILDYAHTINATKEILTFADSVKKRKIITVVGSAGGREKEKRSTIGKIVTDYSDKVIFTMDDPRYEKVKDIVKQMVKDIKKNNYIYIKNRKRAIKKAIKIAEENDIILVLGKGCDSYMAVKNKYKKYNDLRVIKRYIRWF